MRKKKYIPSATYFTKPLFKFEARFFNGCTTANLIATTLPAKNNTASIVMPQ